MSAPSQLLGRSATGTRYPTARTGTPQRTLRGSPLVSGQGIASRVSPPMSGQASPRRRTSVQGRSSPRPSPRGQVIVSPSTEDLVRSMRPPSPIPPIEGEAEMVPIQISLLKSSETPEITGMLEEQFKSTIEEELASLRYVTLEKLIIKSDDGPYAQYLKVVNPGGQTHFVEIDELGKVASEPPFYTELSQPSAIDVSLRSGAYRCLSNEIEGVVFESSGQLTFLSRSPDDPRKVTERTISAIDLGSNQIGENDFPAVYPLVKLSILKKNPIGIMTCVGQATDRLRRAVSEICVPRLIEIERAIQDLYAVYTRYREMQPTLVASVKRDIEDLNNYNHQYLTNAELREQNMDRFMRVQPTLRKRQEYVEKSIWSTCTISKALNCVQNATNTIKSELEHLTQLYAIISGNANTRR